MSTLPRLGSRRSAGRRAALAQLLRHVAVAMTILTFVSLRAPVGPSSSPGPPTHPVLSSTHITPTAVRDWDASRWSQETRNLLQSGISTIILTWSVDDSGGGPTAKTAHYPTSMAGYRQAMDAWGREIDVVGAALAATAAAGMTIWIGLQLDTATWFTTGQLDPEWLSGQAKLAGAIAAEISERYASKRHVIAGWYLPHENNNYDALGSRPDIMRAFFLEVGAALDAVEPTLPVMISPFTIRAAGTPAQYQAFWKHALSGTTIDVVALQTDPQTQSSPEADARREDVVREWVCAVASGVAAANSGAITWANIELFQSDLNSATVAHVVSTMRAASECVRTFTSFSFTNQWSPWTLADDGYARAYRHYVDTGRIPAGAPIAPEMREARLAEGGLRLSWKPATEAEFLTAYYEVYVQNGSTLWHTRSPSRWTTSVTVPELTSGSYVIRTIDAAGNVSVFAPFPAAARTP